MHDGNAYGLWSLVILNSAIFIIKVIKESDDSNSFSLIEQFLIGDQWRIELMINCQQ